MHVSPLRQLFRNQRLRNCTSRVYTLTGLTQDETAESKNQLNSSEKEISVMMQLAIEEEKERQNEQTNSIATASR